MKKDEAKIFVDNAAGGRIKVTVCRDNKVEFTDIFDEYEISERVYSDEDE